MNMKADILDEIEEIDLLVTQQANELSAMLHEHRLEMFPPDAQKTLRPFQLAEVAGYLGVTSGYLKNLSLEGKGPLPMVTPTGRRS
jgi:chromosome partitioning protein